jgi:hypothetical protein
VLRIPGPGSVSWVRPDDRWGRELGLDVGTPVADEHLDLVTIAVARPFGYQQG